MGRAHTIDKATCASVGCTKAACYVRQGLQDCVSRFENEQEYDKRSDVEKLERTYDPSYSRAQDIITTAVYLTAGHVQGMLFSNPL